MKLKLPILLTAGIVTGFVAIAASIRPTTEQVSGTEIGIQGESKNIIANLSTQNIDSNLPPVHPDEPTEQTLNQRFSFETSLDRVKQIDSALTDFRKLTEQQRSPSIPPMNHTDWETQNLGFHNWVGSVEGTLRQQNYKIRKLEFELAQKQFQDGEISKADLEQKSRDYQIASQDFQTFWQSFKVAD